MKIFGYMDILNRLTQEMVELQNHMHEAVIFLLKNCTSGMVPYEDGLYEFGKNFMFNAENGTFFRIEEKLVFGGVYNPVLIELSESEVEKLVLQDWVTPLVREIFQLSQMKNKLEEK